MTCSSCFKGLIIKAKRGNLYTAEIQTASGDPVPYRNSRGYRHLRLEAADRIWGWALRVWRMVQRSHDQISSSDGGRQVERKGARPKLGTRAMPPSS